MAEGEKQDIRKVSKYPENLTLVKNQVVQAEMIRETEEAKNS